MPGTTYNLNREQAGHNTAAPYRWLVSVRPIMGEDSWYEACREVLLEPTQPHLPEAGEILRTIGGLVIGA